MLDKYIRRENEYMNKLERMQGWCVGIGGIGFISLGITSAVGVANYLITGEHLFDTSKLYVASAGIEGLVTCVPMIPFLILENLINNSNKRINRRQRDIFGI